MQEKQIRQQDFSTRLSLFLSMTDEKKTAIAQVKAKAASET